MAIFLGVDVGTYETKGVLADETGRILASAARRHKMLVPQPGWAEHRPDEDWWGDFVHVTQQLLTETRIDARDIKAVATSAIGPCMLPVDADGRPLMNGVLYGVDTRSVDEIAELNARIGDNVIHARCGNALTSQATGPKMLWLKRKRPEIHAKTAKFLTSTSYLTWKLTGRYAIDHYSAANSAPLYDVEKQDWTFDLAGDIATREQLPDLLWSSEIAGEVTPAAAAETGLVAGTPVTAGTIDAAAEALSVGVAAPGDMMLMYGSSIFIIMATADPVRDPRLWYAPWLFAGEHASMAGIATSGTLTHWFRDQLARDLEAAEAFPSLVKEAATSPLGANGLLLLPYFSGERHNQHAKGALFGLNLTHTRGDLFRAFLEGIAYAANIVFETYAEIGNSPQRVVAVGGGVKNRLWLQAMSDVCGVDQFICRQSIGASYGDAFLGALATGAVKRRDIAQWNPVADTVQSTRRPVYDRQYRLFRRLYEQTRDIAEELGAGR